MNEVKVLKCHCTNSYQDQKYGPKMRVHNEVNKEKSPTFRCTVCGDKKPG